MRFGNPSKDINGQDSFAPSEVGVIHPNTSAYVKLTDTGDIHIVVSDSLAIVLHKETNSITFVADTIKFLTKDGDSIRWNNSNLNSKAVDFTQPALIPLDVQDMGSVYDGSDTYYESEERGD